MDAHSVTKIEMQLGPTTPSDTDSQVLRKCVGILVADPVSQRLLESAATQLELIPVFLSQYFPDSSSASQFELIIAEESLAQSIVAASTDRETRSDSIRPALVAVRPWDGGEKNDNDQGDSQFDGVLALPLELVSLVAQLSLILYAHRAFARRYRSTLEELHLNRRIFRSVTSGISVSNARLPDLPLVYVNPAFEVMTGYSLEEVIGRNCRFLQAAHTDQPGLKAVRESLQQGRETVALVKNYRKDGTAFWNELSLSPIHNREGEVTHFVGIQTDVTARVEFEAALRESEKLAAVGRLASSIAHEINNPLESVMNLIYLARGSEDLIESRRYLDIADTELKQVSLITSQSLRFYKQSTRPQAMLPSEVFDSVLNMYAGQLANARVTVETRYRTNRAAVCLQSEIRQVLNNLVRNAIDAMRAHGGRLLVRTRSATDRRSGRQGVALTVADTGSGMSRSTMRQIYTAFFTTKGIGGNGLGLWISSEIIARHKGRLLVRSSQRSGASGTVFQLFLPLDGDKGR